MIIKRMAASFGKLHGAELALGDGLNIIEAPNESGKSTWCAFIRTMLYGINSSERDRTGIHLADKNRYLPWDGFAMSGSMELSWNGNNITIERKSQGAASFRVFSAVYTGSSDAVSELTGKNVGEIIIGAAEPVFLRSAFIRRPDMAVGQTPELEKRISALVSSGEEDTSYSGADELLRRWLRRRKYNSGGLIPKLEKELSELDEAISGLSRRAELQAENRKKLAACEKQRELCLHQLAIHELRQQYDIQQNLKKAREEFQEAARQKKALDKMLGGSLGREELYSLRRRADALELAERTRLEAEKELENLKISSENAENAKKNSPFYPQDPSEAESKIAQSAARYRELDVLTGPPSRTLLFSAVLCFLAAVGAAALGFFSLGLYAYGAAGALGLTGLALLATWFAASTRSKKYASEKEALLREIGAESFDTIYSAVRAYRDLCYNSEKAAVAFTDAASNLSNMNSALDAARSELLISLRTLQPDAELQNAQIIISAREKLIDSYDAAKLRQHSAAQLYDSLTGTYKEDMNFDFTLVPESPETSKNELFSQQRYIDREIALLTRSLDTVSGELKALGDPVVLASRRSQVLEELDNARQEYAALDLAIQTLSESDGTIQGRFSPILSEKAAEYLSQLTGGRYSKMFFDRSLSARVIESGQPVTRDSLYLSDGTLDQMYLALRLAICSLALPDNELCPLILDDALINFDDRRHAAAMDLLLELSRSRQILIFTCHSREASYFKDTPSVTRIYM